MGSPQQRRRGQLTIPDPASRSDVPGGRHHRPTGQLALALVVTLAMIFGALTPFVVGALSPHIVPALELSKKQLGLFVTLTFAVATVVAVPIGRLIDRVESRLVITVLFAISAATLLGLAGARSLLVFLALALPAGVVQAACNPVTNRLVALHTPTRYRGLVLGTKQAGVHVGGFLAGLVLPAIALAAGWRTGVSVAAVASVAALWLAHRLVPRGAAGGWGAATGAAAPRFSWREGGVPYLAVYAFLMGGGVAAITTYLPLYANERLAMDETTSGSALAAFALTGVAARLVWGWIGDRVTRVAAVLGGLALFSAAASLVLWQAELGATWTVWVAAVGLGLSAGAWNAVGMLAVVREVRSAHVGRATGLVSLGFFGGFIVSPTAFGALVDTTDDYSVGWLAITAQFVLATALTLWWARRDRTRARPSLSRDC